MNGSNFFKTLTTFLLFYICFLTSAIAQELTSEFTYQGELVQNGELAEGQFDIRFNLLDDPDPVLGTILGTDTVLNVDVLGGRFTTQVDFGEVFFGEQAWVEIQVREAGQGSLSPLLPTQPITAAPYASFALNGNPGPQGIPGPVGPQGETGPPGPSVGFESCIRVEGAGIAQCPSGFIVVGGGAGSCSAGGVGSLASSAPTGGGSESWSADCSNSVNPAVTAICCPVSIP